MRRTLLVGLGLAGAAVVAVLASAAFDLELESVTLLGVAAGAVVALVPDRAPAARLTGFLVGFVLAWIGYAARAAILPDSAGGKAVAVAVVILAGTALVAATAGRLPFWAVLLGAGTFAGAYEYAYTVAPAELATTSVSTATALLVTVAVGYVAAAAAAPRIVKDRVAIDVAKDRSGSTHVIPQHQHEMEHAR